MKTDDPRATREPCNPSLWLIYEREKVAWIDSHPEATYQEYQAAIREINERMGI